MKKFALLLAALFVGVVVFAQQLTPIKHSPEGKIVKLHNLNFSKGTIIFAEDFSEGALPEGWQNIDHTGGGVWEFDNPGNRTFYSTTADNGFAIFDSDHYGNDGIEENADLITPPIDLSNYTENVYLYFEHYFRSGYGGQATLYISGDGGNTWDLISQWASSSTANAEVFIYDMTPYLGNDSVMIKWNWQGDWSWYWAVDDIKIYQQMHIDFGATAIGPEYVFKGDSVQPYLTISNEGLDTFDTYKVYVQLLNQAKDVVYQDSILVSGDTLFPGADTTFVFSYTPPNLDYGHYTLQGYVVLENDQATNNDTISIDFRVPSFFYDRDFVYSYDGYDATGSGLNNYLVGVDITNGSIFGIRSATVDDNLLAGDFVGCYDTTKLYAVSFGDKLYLFDDEGYTYFVGDMPVSSITGFTWDKTTDSIYILTWTGNLYTFNLNNFVATFIGSTGIQYAISLACDTAGNLYALSLTDTLYRVNKQTAAATTVGYIGFDINYAQDIGFDRTTNTLYGTLYDYSLDTGGLFIIDTLTGNASLIGSYYGDWLTLTAIFTTPVHQVLFHVTDTAGVNLAGATITVGDSVLTTDNNGLDSVLLPEGYTFTAITTLNGYYPDTTTFTVADTPMTVNIVLTPLPPIDTVVFFTSDSTGNAIDSVMIVINNAKGDTLYTDTNGYATAVLEYGNYSVAATKEGYQDTTVNFSVPADTVNIVMVEIQTLVNNLGDVNVYPNPTSGQITVALNGNYTLTIANLEGKVLLRKQFNGVANIDISKFENGMYLLRVENEKGYAVYKIIKK